MAASAQSLSGAARGMRMILNEADGWRGSLEDHLNPVLMRGATAPSLPMTLPIAFLTVWPLRAPVKTRD